MYLVSIVYMIILFWFVQRAVSEAPSTDVSPTSSTGDKTPILISESSDISSGRIVPVNKVSTIN